MDANQFKQFMAQQATMMDKMIEKIRVREAPAGAPVLPVPTPSPLMVDGDMEENFDFFERSWEDRESVDEYSTRLKTLARVAKLGTLNEELITYKLITSNKWPQLRSKMLAMTDLTLEKVVDMCRAEEITAKRSQDLAVPDAEVNKVAKSNVPSEARVQQEEFTEVKDESESEEESDVDASSEDSSEEFEIGKIIDNSDKGGSVSAELELKISDKWRKVISELDTGANTSLIGQECLVKLYGGKCPIIFPSKMRLQSFGGNPIKVLGEVKIPCRRSGRKYRLVLQVVEGAHRPLLSAKVSRVLGFVKFCKSVCFGGPDSTSPDKLLKVYRVEAQKIVDKHQSLFDGYGKLDGEVSLEVDHTVPPSIQPPRRVPIALRGQLKKELEVLEKEGIVVKEPRHTDWVSNIVIVQRGDQSKKSLRVCLDPVPLNKALKRPKLQFVTLDEILPELGKAKVFSTVDAKKGFWHVVLDEPSSQLTTFWTPFGRYRWVRLPFGIAPAPEIFQMKLQGVIQGLPGVECIADDLLVFGVGDTFEDALANHNVCLEKLLCRLKEHNIKLNKEKLKLCETSVKFYGHVLTNKGLQPDETKISTIRNYPTPTDRKAVHRFIGMVNYLSRFIPNLSANLTSLRKLIVESQPWQWTKIEAEEFERVKSLVSDTDTLRYYDVNQPITVECDASCFGLGVAVYQGDGVVGYASRTLTPTEQNYAQIEKELLAILFACIRFDQLIVGNPKAVIKTDHKPLLNIFNKPLLAAPRRLQHMLLNLQRYRLTVEYVTGKDNVVADALSRAPTRDDQPWDQYKKLHIYKVFEELEDVKLKNFLSISDSRLDERGWPASAERVPDSVRIYFGYRNELSTQNGIVFRGDRILVPQVLRRKLIDCCHISHNGIEATLKLARANLFWPGMSSQITDVVKSCSVCAKFAASQPHPPMISHSIPVHPFQMVSMDVFFAEYRGHRRNFLVTVDHYSDFLEVDILKDLTPQSVIAACQENFARHGKPQRMLTDNATNFVNKQMMKFAEDWDFELVTSAPHHQQANGKSEAAVKIAKRLLAKANETGTDFWFALLHWRNIPNKIGSSPVARLFSRSTRCGVPSTAANLVPKVVENVPASIEENRKRIKYQYDKKARNLPELETGSPVFVQLTPQTSKLWTPAVISNRLSERSYTVEVNGKDYRRSLVHLKPRKEHSTSPARLSPTVPEPRAVQPDHPEADATRRLTSVELDCQLPAASPLEPTIAVMPPPGSSNTTPSETTRDRRSTLPASEWTSRAPAKGRQSPFPSAEPGGFREQLVHLGLVGLGCDHPRRLAPSRAITVKDDHPQAAGLNRKGGSPLGTPASVDSGAADQPMREDACPPEPATPAGRPSSRHGSRKNRRRPRRPANNTASGAEVQTRSQEQRAAASVSNNNTPPPFGAVPAAEWRLDELLCRPAIAGGEPSAERITVC
ncbi:uncharacterized protein K02A2.6 [Culex quinquefasciatus]|uniref:uncharacterized protein K02A2.6 n=1 Tax=Culex quinquefasciatus TaxID=7176 RepID=UPI0018E2ADB5|nr:uncharacterized protein K02A2.6 [Culex quinquefasciatus]